YNSTASGPHAVAMGFGNSAGGQDALAMGNGSTANGSVSTALGFHNNADGNFAVAMGQYVTASGDNSVALGFAASTNHKTGAFIFADVSNQFIINAQADNSFTVRAAGGTTFYSAGNLSAGVSLAPGAGAWTTVSDVNRKHLFRDESGEVALGKIASL